MDSAEECLAQALRCVRLRRTVVSPELKRDLGMMALEYLGRATRTIGSEQNSIDHGRVLSRP
jgi:hypothetical protein